MKISFKLATWPKSDNGLGINIQLPAVNLEKKVNDINNEIFFSLAAMETHLIKWIFTVSFHKFLSLSMMSFSSCIKVKISTVYIHRAIQYKSMNIAMDRYKGEWEKGLRRGPPALDLALIYLEFGKLRI